MVCASDYAVEEIFVCGGKKAMEISAAAQETLNSDRSKDFINPQSLKNVTCNG